MNQRANRDDLLEDNPLLSYFMRNSGLRIHKWIDYFDVYHRIFRRYRERPIRFLEIGVQNGGSLRMWRDYFGPQAILIGVDVDPRCLKMEAEGYEIWIGDQADPAFWQQFSEKHPSLDVIIDDGGHTMTQQIVTFQSLFPRLADGGTYLCEDTHSSYFAPLGGGLRKPGTFHEYVKGLIDEMHAWYHAPLAELERPDHLAMSLYSLSVYDSMVVMEKRRRNHPLALVRGNEGHIGLPVGTTFVGLRHAFNVPDA